MLKPGATIGILGGGQLGRMLALAGARLGLKAHILAPEPDSPAFAVAAACTVASYGDEAALSAFAASIDCATYEFENVPAEAVDFLEARLPVRPGSKALRMAQDRVAEKRLAAGIGARTVAFAEIDDVHDIVRSLEAVGLPAILKTRRFGYDGKGQAKLSEAAGAAAAHAAIGGMPAILESLVAFDRELSVVAARGADGLFSAFEPTENEHRDHILHRSFVPARISRLLAAEALAITQRIGEALGHVGVFAVEFFALGDIPYVNEIAPRVHNSGHWTLDGAETSQFEQHMRAVAGWPLGATGRLAPHVVMTNLIGDEADAWASLLAEPGARLHLYGKAQARLGRKMGHVTRLSPRQA